jgi:hypothetical protein
MPTLSFETAVVVDVVAPESPRTSWRFVGSHEIVVVAVQLIELPMPPLRSRRRATVRGIATARGTPGTRDRALRRRRRAFRTLRSEHPMAPFASAAGPPAIAECRARPAAACRRIAATAQRAFNGVVNDACDPLLVPAMDPLHRLAHHLADSSVQVRHALRARRSRRHRPRIQGSAPSRAIAQGPHCPRKLIPVE